MKLFYFKNKSNRVIEQVNNDFGRRECTNSEDLSKGKDHFRVTLFIGILLVCSLAIHLIKANTVDAKGLQEGIADEIIRFHVIANSDSKEDQALKYEVKDALVNEMSVYLSAADNIQDAREILNSHLSSIQEIAETIVKNHGFRYPISVSLEPCYFPLKVYGEYCFPPGTYEALRVQIGEAKGQNWWCVMFPPLCFVDETYGIVNDKSEEQLKYLLTEEEYESLKKEKAPVKVKFKLLEYVKGLFD
jgi:stage II sporulation protein R